MKKGQVSVIFDRKYKVGKNIDGVGTVDVIVYISRTERKYLAVGKCKRSEFEDFAGRKEVQLVVRRCEKVLAALPVLNLDVTVDNFNTFYYQDGEPGSVKAPNPKDLYNGTDQNTDFIEFMSKMIAEEDIREGTFKHKKCTVRALQAYGKIRTFADLTPSNIMGFDAYLRDGSRTEVSIYTYHKHLRKVVRYLYMMEMIPSNPYGHVRISRGTSKQRKPLTEEELKKLRDIKLTGKLDRARDLFIISAYTGLSYCDLMDFDFKEHAVKEGDLFYIDGSRIKTGTDFYTPILAPAMDAIKKYDYKLPHYSNQKGNAYLQLVQMLVGIRKKVTFHVARHSFATMMLSHGVPMEELARMLGHKDLKVTQIYGKILNSTIWNRSESVSKEIL